MQIKRYKDRSFFVNQKLYVQNIIEKFRISEANPVKIPADNYSNLTQDKQSKFAVHVPLKEATGALVFLATISRPDIAYAVGVSSRKTKKPKQADKKSF